MRKIIALILAVVMILSFSACEKGPSSEEIIAAGEILDNLDIVFTAHCNGNEDVLIANTVSAVSGCATRMTNLTSQLKHMTHDEFVEALASIVALFAEEQGNDDPGAIYEWCVTMDDPSDMFYIFNESYVPKACGMAIQAHASVLSGTDENFDEAKADFDAFKENFPESELLPALENYFENVETYREISEEIFVIDESALIEITFLEEACKLSREAVADLIIK